MKKIAFLIFLAFIGQTIFVFQSCSKELSTTNTFTDPRDGQSYATIEIGSQTWFAENLNYETNNSWWYNDNSANGDIYGRLYTWDAAMNGEASSNNVPSGVQGVCPQGWHLPSDDEWKALEMYLGMSQSEAGDTEWRGTNEGEKMKSTSGWYDNGNGTNRCGFNALPGGIRNSNGPFRELGEGGYWWSATEGSGTSAWRRSLSYNYDQVYRYSINKMYGRSVRCIKD